MIMAACGILLVMPLAASSQMDSLARSHIEGNLPEPRDFKRFLIRDLESYSQAQLHMPVTGEYSLLRDGLTQAGIAYPDYYAWVRIYQENKLVAQGAV